MDCAILDQIARIMATLVAERDGLLERVRLCDIALAEEKRKNECLHRELERMKKA